MFEILKNLPGIDPIKTVLNPFHNEKNPSFFIISRIYGNNFG
jgi:hypothetical protein